MALIGQKSALQTGVVFLGAYRLGPVDPSFGALSGRIKLTVRRHKFSKDSLFFGHWACRRGMGGVARAAWLEAL